VLEPVSFEDVLRDIRAVGAALGVVERAEALVAGVRAEIRAVPARAVRPKVLVEWWPKPVIVPGRRSWVTDLIEAAGGSNPFGDRDVKSCPITDAEAGAAAPDAVVIAWCGVPASHYRPEVVARRPAWADVPAVRDGRIVPITEAWLGRPGPRLVEGFRALRAVVDAVPEVRASR
jgi:iron complex transport system substrate-binding protein